MRRRQLRDFLLSLVLSGMPFEAGCQDQEQESVDDMAYKSPCYIDDMVHQSTVWINGKTPDGGSSHCKDACDDEFRNRPAYSFVSCEEQNEDMGESSSAVISCTFQAIGGPMGCGRAPAGLVTPTTALRRCPSPTPIGEYLARAAYLEAASVTAFHRIADELAAHDAPARLIAHARRAARQEARHAGL